MRQLIYAPTVATIALLTMTGLTSGCSNDVQIATDEPQSNEDTSPVKAKIWRPWEQTNKAYKSASVITECPQESDEVRYIDPIPALVKLARKNKVVMINEAHSKPLHRVFIREFAKALSQEGFMHYGAEAFKHRKTKQLNSEIGLANRGYPITSEGTYIDEPVFGQALEEIVNYGYKFFSYEGDSKSLVGDEHPLHHRERQQTENILTYIGSHPNDKFLIHAGYHHIKEAHMQATGNLSPTHWMINKFKQKSDIDPLTISQTDCYGTSYRQSGTLGYALIADKNGNPIVMDGYDVTLVPPVEPQDRDRPVWLTTHLGRKLVDVPKAAIFDEHYTLIVAKNINRHEQATPEDEIYRAPYSDKALALRPGTYELKIYAEKDVLLTSLIINVAQ